MSILKKSAFCIAIFFAIAACAISALMVANMPELIEMQQFMANAQS